MTWQYSKHDDSAMWLYPSVLPRVVCGKEFLILSSRTQKGLKNRDMHEKKKDANGRPKSKRNILKPRQSATKRYSAAQNLARW